MCLKGYLKICDNNNIRIFAIFSHTSYTICDTSQRKTFTQAQRDLYKIKRLEDIVQDRQPIPKFLQK